jgi:LCP family protein required for cell wall assembly
MKIDFLEKEKVEKPKKRIFGAKFVAVFSILTLLFFYNLIFTKSFFKLDIPTSPQEVTKWAEEKINFLGQIGRLVRSSDKKIKGEESGRINILLLGMGGEGHDGAYLTDTIILASIKPDGEIAMLSIPRDLLVSIPGYGWRKINEANAFAELKEPGSGGEFASQIISQTFGVPIDYYVRIDFDGFKKLIDDLGGLGIYVENSFTDYSYPTPNFKYQTVSFEKGWQVMDGETALEFVRSRHGTNGESSDFARSRRQQKVLLALKEKILSLSTLINPQKIYKIISSYKENVKTNFEIWEVTRLAKLAKDVKNQEIIHKVLDDSPGSPLYAANVNGAYVLEPRAGDFSELQYIAKNIFDLKDQAPLPEAKIPSKIEIQNGTKKTGLAANTTQTLEKLGYEIVKFGNAPKQDYEKTIIYDLTQGKKLDELAFLKEKLNADVSLSIPAWFLSPFSPSEVTILDKTNTLSQKNNIDFLIILGKNANYF